MNNLIKVNDGWQKDYIYETTSAVGKDFDKSFKPQLTPKQMLDIGVFSGMYFWDKPKELPSNWFINAKLSKDGKPDKALNFYEVEASQSLNVWNEKGWIYPDDPRGWLQWYSRYYLGRRIVEEDERQIKRWKAMSRHVSQVSKNCHKRDLSCRRRQRQALLHWAYDSRDL